MYEFFSKKLLIGGGGEKNPYSPNQVVFYKSSSTAIESITLYKGRYKVELVGGGGGQSGGVTSYLVAGGAGSGSAFVGTLKVDKETIFDVYSGNLGSSNRTIGGSGGYGADGTNSWISEHGNLNIRIYCNSAGTGTGSASTGSSQKIGSGGTIVDLGNFVSKWMIETTLRVNGKPGTRGQYVTTFGTGGASVYQGFGRGAGPQNNNGTAGLVRITYLGK